MKFMQVDATGKAVPGSTATPRSSSSGGEHGGVEVAPLRLELEPQLLLIGALPSSFLQVAC